VDSRQRVMLDIDSTEIPVYGEQEHSAYDGHFESTLLSAGEACALLLATLGGRTSDAAAVRADAGSDRATADTHGIDNRWRSGRQRSLSEASWIRRRGVEKVVAKQRSFSCAGADCTPIQCTLEENVFTLS